MAADLFHSISVFVKVAEAKSFTGAARRLGITPSGASKVLARLEERLGVRLVSRTTRRVSLTADGDAFYESCRRILADLEDAEAVVQRRRKKLQGRFRIQVPIAFGRKIVIPLLVRFLEMHQELAVDVALADLTDDAPREGIDLLVHMGEVRGTSVVARKLCDLRYVTVASPEYLARHGEPMTPDDLRHHRCLAYYMPQTNRYRDWNFSFGRRNISRPINGALNVNSAEGLLEGAIAGGGIAAVSTFIAADAVRAGKLRILLRDYVCSGPQVSAVYLSRRQLPERVRAFVDYLTSAITPNPPWDAILDG